MVFEGTDRPLADVIVEIIGPKSRQPIDAVLTNKRGVFSFRERKYRETGPWLLRFSLPGFMSVEQALVIKSDHGQPLVLELPLGI